MWFLGLGLVFLVLKIQGLTLVATWEWWWVLSPFALAAAWWTWADASGYSKRKAVERENVRKEARINRQREGMGLPTRKKK